MPTENTEHIKGGLGAVTWGLNHSGRTLGDALKPKNWTQKIKEKESRTLTARRNKYKNRLIQN